MANINTGQTEGKRNFRSSIKKGIWTLVLFIIVAIAGVIGRDTGKYFTRSYLPSVSNNNSSILQMKRYNIGSTGLSILSPGALKERNLSVPDDFKDKILSFQNFEYSKGHGIAITCSKVTYIPEITASAESAASSVLKSLSNLSGVSGFHNVQKPITQSSLNGIKYSAEYVQNSAQIKAYGVVLTSGSRMWQVGIFCPATKNESIKIAEKILNSIIIEMP